MKSIPAVVSGMTILAVAMILSCATGEGAETVVDQPDSREAQVSIEGTWQGRLSAGGTSVRLVFRISRDEKGWAAVADSPDQGATGIPVESVALNGLDLRIAVPAVGGVYEGRVDKNGAVITGVWKQGGGSFELNLEPVEEVVKVTRPQDPVPPFPYRAEEVRFRNDEAGIQLAGTLTLPEGDGPFPAAVLITGSGPQNRDEEIMNHRPFLVIADHLSRSGIAVLRFDDRGVGESEGDYGSATSRDFAGDAWSGYNYLAARGEIDSSRIGLVGHSEGGIIATMLAAEHGDISFIVLLAGLGVPSRDLLVLQSAAILQASGGSAEQIAAARETNEKVYDVILAEADDTKAAEQITTILASVGVPEAQITAHIASLLSPWYRFFLGYDPRPDLERITCPVLALNGDLDLQVPSEENLPAISAALAAGGNSAVTIRELAGLNHLFQHASTGLVAEYSQIEETFAPEALELIAGWLVETVGLR